jgi:hypothetical protein
MCLTLGANESLMDTWRNFIELEEHSRVRHQPGGVGALRATTRCLVTLLEYL